MRKSLTAIMIAVAGLLYTQPQATKSSDIVVLSGNIDCRGGKVIILKSSHLNTFSKFNAQKFANFNDAMVALRNRGYSREGLEQLGQVLQKACREGMLDSIYEFGIPSNDKIRTDKSSNSSAEAIADGASLQQQRSAVFGKASSILRLEKSKKGIKFTVYDKNLESDAIALSRHASSQAEKGKERDCKQTSYNPPADCFKCENPLDAWCNIAKLR